MAAVIVVTNALRELATLVRCTIPEMFVEIQAAYLVLRTWKENPGATKRQMRVSARWNENWDESNSPLSSAEVQRMKIVPRPHAPSSLFELFPEGQVTGARKL